MEKPFKIYGIIPVFNTPVNVLNKCIESILNQTYDTFNILLIDDGSQDNCAKSLDLIATSDSRFSVYHKNNGGVSSARNFGLNKLQEILGTDHSNCLLTFIDSDDILEPSAWSKVVQLFNNRNIDAISYSWTDYLPNDKTIPHFITAEHACSTPWKFQNMMDKISQGLLPDFMVNHPDILEVSSHNFIREICQDNIFYGGGYPWNKVWKISSLLDNYPSFPSFDESLTIYEDKLWCIEAAIRCDNIAITSELLYRYIFVSDSITRKDSDILDRQPAAYDAYDKIINFLEKVDKQAYINACNFYYDIIFEDLGVLTDEQHKNKYKLQHQETLKKYKSLCKRIKPKTLNYAINTPQFINWARYHFI